MDIRIMSFNIHKGVGWMLRQSTMDQIRRQLRILNPDVILLQEVRGHQFDLLCSEVWSHFSYGKNAISPRGHYGNAILSKFPISFTENIDLTTHRYERRGLLHSIILLEKPSINIHLLCVHLGLLKIDRAKQLNKVIEFIKSRIPNDEYIIFGGDFNDWSGFATKHLVFDLGFREAFLTTTGHYARTYPVWAPMLKLDRLYSRGFQIIKAERLLHKPWRALSDHVALEVALEPQIVGSYGV